MEWGRRNSGRGGGGEKRRKEENVREWNGLDGERMEWEKKKRDILFEGVIIGLVKN